MSEIRLTSDSQVLELVGNDQTIELSQSDTNVYLDTSSHDVYLGQEVTDISLNQQEQTIEFTQVGLRGLQGADGDDGNAATIQIGEVTSGTTPSVENVGTPTDAIFNITLPKGDTGDSGGDKHFVYNFTNRAEIVVEHSLDKRPAVSIEDSSGDEVEAEVEYLNVNSLLVRFSAPFTGRIICN